MVGHSTCVGRISSTKLLVPTSLYVWVMLVLVVKTPENQDHQRVDHDGQLCPHRVNFA